MLVNAAETEPSRGFSGAARDMSAAQARHVLEEVLMCASEGLGFGVRVEG